MRLRLLSAAWALLMFWAGSNAQAQEPLAPCVRSFGHTGCAARLYAQLLCESFDQPALLLAQLARLAEDFEREGISFAGIGPDAVETAAVRYYTPMLCQERSPRIRTLFQR